MNTEDTEDYYYTWVTKDGTVDSGSEVEMMIAVHLGDIRGVEYDPATGLYSWPATD